MANHKQLILNDNADISPDNAAMQIHLFLFILKSCFYKVIKLYFQKK